MAGAPGYPTPGGQPGYPQPGGQGGYAAPGGQGYPPMTGNAPAPGYQAQQYPPPQAPQGPMQPSYGGQPTATEPKPNPFEGVRPGDFTRLGLGLVLLLVSLAFQWDGEYRDAERLEVLLITLLSVLSVAGFVLGRLRILPPGPVAINFRLVLNIPYFVMVLVYLVGAFVASFTVVDTFPGGIGPAMSLGLAGALLVAQPLECEIRDLPTGSVMDRIWRILVTVPAGIVALGGLLALIGVFVAEKKPEGVGIVGAIVLVLGSVAALVLPALGVLRRDPRWLMAVMCIGAATLLLVLIVSESGVASMPVGMINFGFGTTFSASYFSLFAWYMWPVLGAIAASASCRREMTPMPEDQMWWGAARFTMVVAVIVGATAALYEVLLLAQVVTFATGAAVTFLLAGVVAIVGGVLGMIMIGRGGTRDRVLVLAIAGAMFLFGLIANIVQGSERYLTGRPGPMLFMIAYGIPLVLVGQVFLAAPMRTWWQKSRGQQAAQPAPGPQPFAPMMAGEPGGPQAQPYVPQTGPAAPLYAPPQAQPVQQPGPSPYGQQPAAPAPGSATPQPAQAPTTWQPPAEAATVRAEQPARSPYATPPAEPTVEPAVEPTVEPATVEQPAAEPMAEAAGSPTPTVEPAPASPGVDGEAGGFTAEQAASPATAAIVLAKIVETRPDLRKYVATNPNAYPALVEWLANLHDPEIDAALAQRNG